MAKNLGIVNLIQTDKELFSLWNRLPQDAKEEYTLIDRGILTPNMLHDTIFKSIFNPDIHGKYLSQFISSIIGQKVTVLHSLDKEGFRYSVFSKSIYLDLLVQFEDGSIGNVEIQRYGYALPPQRSSCYSANLVTRQYAVAREQKKSEINYESLRPVYTIIILEDSPVTFALTKKYLHHFRQRSDTGLELEFLQYYDYVCMDIFKEQKPHIAGELEKWLDFLSIRNANEMKSFLKENPSFQPVYNRAIMATKDKEGLLDMFYEFLENEDVVQVAIKYRDNEEKRMKERIMEMESVISQQDAEIARLKELLKEKQ